MSAAALLAASVAPLTAIPQSACLRAGASLTPSPVMPTMWPRACRVFTISHLCCGKTRPKPSARSTASVTAALTAPVVLEDIACDQKMIAEIELGGDLIADRDVVAGHHLDIDAKCLGGVDRRLGIRARRIHQRDEPDDAPALAIVRLADAEGAIAFAGEFGDGALVAGEEVGIRLGQRRDRLRRALGVVAGLAGGIDDRRNGALIDRIERDEVCLLDMRQIGQRPSG